MNQLQPETISNIIKDVAELSDRNSPEGWPEAMIVTGDELREIIERHIFAGQQGSGDALSEFQEGQWWLQELDTMAADGTPDQRRAVSVVRNLMRTAHARLATSKPAADVPLPERDELAALIENAAAKHGSITTDTEVDDGWHFSNEELHAFGRALIDAREAAGRAAGGVATITREVWEAGRKAYAEWIMEAYQNGSPDDDSRKVGQDRAVSAMRAALLQHPPAEGEDTDPDLREAFDALVSTVDAVANSGDYVLSDTAGYALQGALEDAKRPAPAPQQMRTQGEAMAHIHKVGGSWEIIGIPKAIRRLPDGHHRIYTHPSPVADADSLAKEVIALGAEREQGYANREHGGVLNGRVADKVVALARRLTRGSDHA